ncbi:hypothetical protein F1C10_11570 [Sphingomonas sp. NBWT7]|uniref:hypothetical protein n=1 Tax=Sphingomonas sp. NBWT7 TaxID=2596913 RepID=UPI0016245077|nr:hypothetical protein [Sphingomonas sp. NBWT7]QNE32522.1 hypothetical protein F1C10_11570 [Sphingomonas sp. NBWT7]
MEFTHRSRRIALERILPVECLISRQMIVLANAIAFAALSHRFRDLVDELRIVDVGWRRPHGRWPAKLLFRHTKDLSKDPAIELGEHLRRPALHELLNVGTLPPIASGSSDSDLSRCNDRLAKRWRMSSFILSRTHANIDSTVRYLGAVEDASELSERTEVLGDLQTDVWPPV